MTEQNGIFNEKTIMQLLNKIYDSTLKDIKSLESAETLANLYLDKYEDPEIAITKLIQSRTKLCATSGFVTNFGGVLSLPVGVPANLASVLYLQIQMINAIAYIRGYNPQDDKVRIFTFLCLTGNSMTDTIKKVGIEIGEKVAVNMINKISAATIAKINQTIGFRLATKFGTKGAINLSSFVPVIGGVISGSIDLLSTQAIAYNAQKVFTTAPKHTIDI